MSESVLHRGLTPERWNRFPLERRLLMIGSEFGRAVQLVTEDGGRTDAHRCYQRARELATWTIQTVPTAELLASRLADVIRMIDETDFERWELPRLVQRSNTLVELVNHLSAQDHAV